MTIKTIKRKKPTQGNADAYIIEPMHSVAWSEVLPSALTLLQKLGRFIIGKEKIATIASDSAHDVKTYIAGFIMLSAISSLGMFLYGLLGGAKYFNKWYLFLMPFISIAGGVALFIATAGVLYYLMWGKKLFTHKKNVYYKHLLIVYIPSQLAWLFYALKLQWPTLNRHMFSIALAILCFMFIKALLKQPKEFSAGSLLLGTLFLAVPYSLLLYFNPEIAASIVRVLGL